MMEKTTDRIRLTTLIYAVYAALTPFDQVLNFSGSGTITKYFGFAVIIVMWIEMFFNGYNSFFVKKNFVVFFLFPLWCTVTVAWGIKGSAFPITIWGLSVLCITCYFRKFNAKETKLILNAMLISTVVLVLMMFRSGSMTGMRATLVTENDEADPNYIGAAIASAFSISMWYFLNSKKIARRLIWALVCGAMFVALIVTGSRTGIIVIVVSVLLEINYVNKKQKSISKYFGILFFLCICIVVLEYAVDFGIVNIRIFDRLTLSNVRQTGGNGRTVIWGACFKAMSESRFRLLFGYGHGSITKVTYRYLGAHLSAHNSFISYFVMTGIPGLVMLIVICVNSYKKAKKEDDFLLVTLLCGSIMGCMTIDFLPRKIIWNVLTLIWASNANESISRNRQVKTEYELSRFY